MNTTRRSFLQMLAGALGLGSLVRCAPPVAAKQVVAIGPNLPVTTYRGIPNAVHDAPWFVFGVPNEIKPIHNLPLGARIRFQFRNNCEAFVYVTTAGGTEKWSLDDYGGHWMLAYCQGANLRPTLNG